MKKKTSLPLAIFALIFLALSYTGLWFTGLLDRESEQYVSEEAKIVADTSAGSAYFSKSSQGRFSVVSYIKLATGEDGQEYASVESELAQKVKIYPDDSQGPTVRRYSTKIERPIIPGVFYIDYGTRLDYVEIIVPENSLVKE